MAESSGFNWSNVDGVAALVRPGVGGTIVIVPGAMADAPGWLAFATALDTEKAIAIVNRRGRAPSADLPEGSSVADEAADVRAVMATLQPPFLLVGWSYGGLLAMEAAVGTAAITSIVLFEPVSAPFAADAIAPISAAVASGNLDRAVAEILARIGGASDKQIAELKESPAWSYLKPLAVPAAIELAAINRHHPDVDAYAMVEAPVSVLLGGLNEGREPYGAATQRFIDKLPGVHRAIIPGQGHLAHAEAPVQLAAAVRSLLRDP